MDGTPDTSFYLAFGYIVILGTMLLHYLSIGWRERAARREIEFLEELKKD